MITKTCKQCGAEFKTYRAWSENRPNSRAGIFCSRECRVIGRNKKPRTIYSADCAECGKTFTYRKGRGGTYTYCSIQCMANARGRMLRGENHPKWNGGSSIRTWSSRRAIKLAVRAAGKCQRCGATEGLQGHHIKQHSKHPELRDAQSNIEVICVSCHALEHPHLAAFIQSHGRLHV